MNNQLACLIIHAHPQALFAVALHSMGRHCDDIEVFVRALSGSRLKTRSGHISEQIGRPFHIDCHANHHLLEIGSVVLVVTALISGPEDMICRLCSFQRHRLNMTSAGVAEIQRMQKRCSK